MTSIFNDTQNKKIVGKMIDELKLNPISDNIPKTVIPTIQPIYSVNFQYATIANNATATASASALTGLTVPADKEFFLTSVHVHLLKDATCDVADSTLLVNTTVNGTAQSVMRFGLLTLTAQDISSALSFPYPVRIDRSTSITLSAPTFTVGKFTRCISVTGFFGDIGQPLTAIV